MSIADIKRTAARRFVLVASLPLVPVVLLVGYAAYLGSAIASASREFWEGFPSGFAETISDAWNGY